MNSHYEVPVERVRRVLRLVTTVHQAAIDPSTCLSTTLEGLRDVFGAAVAVVGLMRDDAGQGVTELASKGWRDEACRHLVLSADAGRLDTLPPLSALADPSRAVATVRRSDVLSDGEWAAHPHLTSRTRPAGLDEWMASGYAIEDRPHTRGVLLVYRETGRPRFAEGERELLHAFYSEAGQRFWSCVGRASAPTVTVRSLDASPTPHLPHAQPQIESLSRMQLMERLTPAQRAVLPYLLEGKTEAEIGKLIYRSRYTVHDHARAIYLALGVRNRVELVLLFTRAGAVPAATAMSGFGPMSN